ncbi:MAG: hypothetical protein WBB08_11200 [Halobacteriota archaeon]
MKKDEVLRVIEEAARNKQVMLYLSGNPLESPPIEIAKQGNMAIRSYFESLEAK